VAFNDILKKMIVDNSLIELVQYYDKWKVRLIEPQEEDSMVEIFGIPKDTIVIKADNFPVPNRFFIGEKSELKRADYIIISQHGDSFYTLIIEMKRGTKQELHIISQLKGAFCLYKYIEEIGKKFWEEPDFLEGHNLRFISFSKTSISKKPSRPNRSTKANNCHDTPENMLKISGSNIIRFEHLLSKPS
jgi:hypothetical protein